MLCLKKMLERVVNRLELDPLEKLGTETFEDAAPVAVTFIAAIQKNENINHLTFQNLIFKFQIST